MTIQNNNVLIEECISLVPQIVDIVGPLRFENLWTGLLIEENRTESGYPTSEADKNLTVPDITEWLGMRTVGTV